VFSRLDNTFAPGLLMTSMPSTSPASHLEKIVWGLRYQQLLCYQQSLGAMGNSIDKISDKFFISSVEPLGDRRRIDELGVTYILNGAEEHLFVLILPHFNTALSSRF
jgi:hypothetical protein